MSFFSEEFRSFFRELAANNNTAWFDENRKRYERAVRKPFVAFVEEMINRIGKQDPEVKIKPSDAITRINKDIRFSKDKTPYHTYVGAIISPAGKKDKSVPGFYFQLAPDNLSVFGGAYVLEKPQLEQVREYITANLAAFQSLYSDNDFKAHYGSIQGAQQKRLPEPLKGIQAREPLIANKQFYFSAAIRDMDVTGAALADRLMEYYQAGRPLNSFLRKALNK